VRQIGLKVTLHRVLILVESGGTGKENVKWNFSTSEIARRFSLWFNYQQCYAQMEITIGFNASKKSKHTLSESSDCSGTLAYWLEKEVRGGIFTCRIQDVLAYSS